MKKILTLLIGVIGLMAVANSQTISAGKALQISITGVPVSEKGKLDNTYSVSATGYIEMWMIGPVKASGKTKAQLAREIADKYVAAEIYTNPVFQIFSDLDKRANENQFVTVGGQVVRSGQIPWTKDMTIYGAVQAAGGATPFGSIKRARLYRRGKVQEIDLKKPGNKSILVYPQDTIEIPQKGPFERG